MLYYLVTALYILVCLTMMLVVYLQQGKGGDIASAFGGGSSQAAFGARGDGLRDSVHGRRAGARHDRQARPELGPRRPLAVDAAGDAEHDVTDEGARTSRRAGSPEQEVGTSNEEADLQVGSPARGSGG